MLNKRSYRIDLLSAFPPAKVLVNGRAVAWTKDETKVGWWYDGDHTTVKIQTPEFAVRDKVTVEVYLKEKGEDVALLDGLPGRIARLKRTMPVLDSQWPVEWSPDVLIHAAQTGDRMTIFPQTAKEEMKAFEGYRPRILDSIQHMTLPDSLRTKVRNHLTIGW